MNHLHEPSNEIPTTGSFIILCIGGIDPSGGAGLIIDAQTVHSAGGHTVCVVTAATLQNPGDPSVQYSVIPTKADVLEQQIATALKDFTVDAIKVGLLPTPDSVRAVTSALASLDKPFSGPIIIDPVWRASSGLELNSADTLREIRASLLPVATITTPNKDEALTLIPEAKDCEDAARILLNSGCDHALVTSAHCDERTLTHLLTSKNNEKQIQPITCDRLPGEYRGSGCRLASAIACHLLHNKNIPAAVNAAQDDTLKILRENNT